jgi:tyrosinase
MNNVIEEMHLPAVEKAFWTAAANHWRLPYWNWGIKQPWLKDYGLPEIFTLEQVAIVGKVDPVSNPLTKFSNPSGVPFGDPSMKTLQIKDHSRKPPAYPVSYLYSL